MHVTLLCNCHFYIFVTFLDKIVLNNTVSESTIATLYLGMALVFFFFFFFGFLGFPGV